MSLTTSDSQRCLLEAVICTLFMGSTEVCGLMFLIGSRTNEFAVIRDMTNEDIVVAACPVLLMVREYLLLIDLHCI